MSTDNHNEAATGLKEIAVKFFEQHPEHRDGVKRAIAAYHQHHRQAGAHYFTTDLRESPCRWCARTREQVRWDDLPPQCASRPEWADTPIESVIAKEELMFEKVLARASTIAATIVVETLTGEELAHMHHTHGVDPSMLEVALIGTVRPLPQSLHDDYQTAYATHKDTGRAGLRKTVIVAKTPNTVINE